MTILSEIKSNKETEKIFTKSKNTKNNFCTK